MQVQIEVAVHRVLAAAQAFMGVTEQGGDNKGQMVELMLKGVGLMAGEPWCCAFVHRVGHYALFDAGTRKSIWPLPATGSCWFLGDFARKHGLLVNTPQPGDVFLVYDNSPKFKRFAHTGFILAVHKDGSCTSIEGNTNNDGSKNGNAVLVKPRTFDVTRGDRFIRWTRLAGRTV